MIEIGPGNYHDYRIDSNETTLCISDHMGGFDSSMHCRLLDEIVQYPNVQKILVEYIVSDQIKSNYSSVDFYFSKKTWEKENHVKSFENYNVHPELNYKNFVCSFNGTGHVGRAFLVSCLQKFELFNPEYSTKNFEISKESIYGNLLDYVSGPAIFASKFLLADYEFNKTIYTLNYQPYDHLSNIKNLESKLTESFLHIVSETLATSFYPFVTEKFLYSIVTRGLFLAYAQPGWHNYLEKYLGFKKYTKLFDYRFDDILNPVDRLLELITMVSKFKPLSFDDYRDLYLLEQDTIEYNYDHYFSQDYLKCLAKFS